MHSSSIMEIRPIQNTDVNAWKYLHPNYKNFAPNTGSQFNNAVPLYRNSVDTESPSTSNTSNESFGEALKPEMGFVGLEQGFGLNPAGGGMLVNLEGLNINNGMGYCNGRIGQKVSNERKLNKEIAVGDFPQKRRGRRRKNEEVLCANKAGKNSYVPNVNVFETDNRLGNNNNNNNRIDYYLTDMGGRYQSDCIAPNNIAYNLNAMKSNQLMADQYGTVSCLTPISDLGHTSIRKGVNDNCQNYEHTQCKRQKLSVDHPACENFPQKLKRGRPKKNLPPKKPTNYNSDLLGPTKLKISKIQGVNNSNEVLGHYNHIGSSYSDSKQSFVGQNVVFGGYPRTNDLPNVSLDHTITSTAQPWMQNPSYENGGPVVAPEENLQEPLEYTRVLEETLIVMKASNVDDNHETIEAVASTNVFASQDTYPSNSTSYECPPQAQTTSDKITDIIRKFFETPNDDIGINVEGYPSKESLETPAPQSLETLEAHFSNQQVYPVGQTTNEAAQTNDQNTGEFLEIFETIFQREMGNQALDQNSKPFKNNVTNNEICCQTNLGSGEANGHAYTNQDGKEFSNQFASKAETSKQSSASSYDTGELCLIKASKTKSDEDNEIWQGILEDLYELDYAGGKNMTLSNDHNGQNSIPMQETVYKYIPEIKNAPGLYKNPLQQSYETNRRDDNYNIVQNNQGFVNKGHRINDLSADLCAIDQNDLIKLNEQKRFTSNGYMDNIKQEPNSLVPYKPSCRYENINPLASNIKYESYPKQFASCAYSQNLTPQYDNFTMSFFQSSFPTNSQARGQQLVPAQAPIQPDFHLNTITSLKRDLYKFCVENNPSSAVQPWHPNLLYQNPPLTYDFPRIHNTNFVPPNSPTQNNFPFEGYYPNTQYNQPQEIWQNPEPPSTPLHWSAPQSNGPHYEPSYYQNYSVMRRRRQRLQKGLYSPISTNGRTRGRHRSSRVPLDAIEPSPEVHIDLTKNPQD